jgi:IPT/TIG domain
LHIVRSAAARDEDYFVCVEQNFKITGIYPTIGPRAGGTEVTFTGQELDTGSNLQVLFDYVPCSIDRLVNAQLTGRSRKRAGCASRVRDV